ncbi:NAD(P)-dependent oxidoreductase [Pseudofrankia asymbiotica]|uniref:6-phosphogluconate dehydrogenase n=1 Tax=Pseudofrankia asymbiotica TaxID=1834516 RepID=A0A1V2IIG7_9ACTN|nr:NAD(P)-dependent oxidoreductase [Pseudofrankia asymbiotica]ONH32917.1 6-phosphogluconate dehydrogenase [Pseudofrankia asymbiotica]
MSHTAPPAPTTRVGFIGLGSQGAPMARRVAEAGYPLTVWARRTASVGPFTGTGTGTGIAVTATPADLGAASDVVGICVVADDDVRDVLLRDDGVLAGMAPGGVIAIHSTIHPDTCRDVAEAAARRGVAILDAPVSGGGGAAERGQLLVMVGGDERDLARCRPVLATFGDPILHLGPLGSGQVAKALNNFLFTTHVGVALDMFAFIDRLGIDRAAAARVLAHGSGGSFAAATLARSGFDTTGLRDAEPLLRKDVGIMLDVARTAGAAEPTTLVELAHHTLADLRDGDGGSALRASTL